MTTSSTAQESKAPACPGCLNLLPSTFVECVECVPVVTVCLNCFAKGKEFGHHANDHGYQIKSLNLTLFSPNWTAAEELQLLDAVKQCGVGNWQDISKQLQSKTELECQDHYLRFYINDPVSSLPALLPGLRTKRRKFKAFKASQMPPRPDQDSEASESMGGYMPCRGDFKLEYDDFAEADVKDIKFEASRDDGLLTELNLAVLDIFWTRLKERCLRKRIIKDYGLLDIRDQAPNWKRHERILRAQLTPFARFHSPEDHEKMISGLLHETMIKTAITSLQTYRRAGIKKKRDGWIYTKLHQRRQSAKAKRYMLSEVLDSCENEISYQLWMHRQMNGNKTIHSAPAFPMLGRKVCPPLDITGLVGFSELSNDEKELCSVLRIVPESYLSYKQMMIKESNSVGCLKLQHARQLVKIDVNKTRKLFNFFMEKGFIK